MKITLTRIARRKTYTIGRLAIDGEYICDTLEPTWRDIGWGRPGKKIAGKTAIPEGRYPVVVTFSPGSDGGFLSCSTCPCSRTSASMQATR